MQCSISGDDILCILNPISPVVPTGNDIIKVTYDITGSPVLQLHW